MGNVSCTKSQKGGGGGGEMGQTSETSSSITQGAPGQHWIQAVQAENAQKVPGANVLSLETLASTVLVRLGPRHSVRHLGKGRTSVRIYQLPR